MKSELISKIREIKIFLFDLEGVLMHNGVLEENSVKAISHACKSFNQLGLIFGIITARTEDKLIRKLRAIEGCFILSSSLDKVSAADKFLSSRSVNYKNVFYMGDDLLDIPLLKKCGVSCAPKSSRREVKRVVNFIAHSDKCEDLLNEIIGYYKKSKETVSRAAKC